MLCRSAFYDNLNDIQKDTVVYYRKNAYQNSKAECCFSKKTYLGFVSSIITPRVIMVQ